MASIRIADSMLPAIGREFGRPPADASGAITLFALAYGVMQLVWGPLGDRVGTLRVIGWAAIAATLGSAACALAPSLDDDHIRLAGRVVLPPGEVLAAVAIDADGGGSAAVRAVPDLSLGIVDDRVVGGEGLGEKVRRDGLAHRQRRYRGWRFGGRRVGRAHGGKQQS